MGKVFRGLSEVRPGKLHADAAFAVQNAPLDQETGEREIGCHSVTSRTPRCKPATAASAYA